MPRTLTAIACAGLVILGLSGCQGGADRASSVAASTQSLDVSTRGCGTDWRPTVAGRQTLLVHNTDSRGGDVQLIEASSQAVVAELDTLGSGSTATLQVDLGAGAFRLRCLLADEDAIEGPVVTVTGSATVTTPAVAPVTRNDLIPVAKAYQAYVSGRLPALQTQTHALLAAVESGDRALARKRWLPAHLTYETLGAAYEAFGDADLAIDGLPDGLPDGLQDKDFTGFHRLEYGLWHGQNAAELTPVAQALSNAVDRLAHAWPTIQVDLLDIALRAHEISENAARFQLTGQSDFGSGTALATAEAELRGTTEVLGLLRSLLTTRLALPPIEALLARTDRDLLAQRHSDGGWTPVSALSRPDKEQLDADFGALDELLSQVAEIAEPRRTT